VPQSRRNAFWQTTSDVIFRSMRCHLDEWRLDYWERRTGAEERIIEQTCSMERA
jgi:hypothetical protein